MPTNEHDLISHEAMLLARKLMLREMRVDSCIASTRVIIPVLKHYGVTARPLSVVANVYNEPMVRWLKRHGWKDPGNDSEARECAKTGGRMVSLGYRAPDIKEEPNGWVGHLVAAIPGKPGSVLLDASGNATPEVPGTIIDLSIDQAHRPHKGIVVEAPLVSRKVPAAWFGGKQQFVGESRAAGIALAYEARPDDTSYDHAPDWKDPNRYELLKWDIIKVLGAFLKLRAESREKETKKHDGT